MDMTLVVTVGARAEHRHEAGARALAHAVAKVLWHFDVSQTEHRAVRELERLYVERIGEAVLGDFRTNHAVAPTAFE